jgi:hypothetical protein
MKMERNLKAIFIFSTNRVNIKISKDNSNEFEFPDYLYDLSDMKVANVTINNVEQSNLGIIITNFPFNFIIYRKESGNRREILFDTRCNSSENMFFYSLDNKQIYTKLPINHFSYGLVKIFNNNKIE